MIFQKLIKEMTSQKHADRKAEMRRNLIRHEAKIGGQLFGPMPKGGRREFFCLDKYTWVWHEEWTDQAGQRHSKNTRYEFRPDGILKSQNGHYSPLTIEESKHLREAIKHYGEAVYREIYSKLPQ